MNKNLLLDFFNFFLKSSYPQRKYTLKNQVQMRKQKPHLREERTMSLEVDFLGSAF